MRVKIISDGTVAGTTVLTEDNQVLEGVQALSFTCALDGAPEALLVLQPISCEIVVDATLALADTGGYQVEDEELSAQELLAFIPGSPRGRND